MSARLIVVASAIVLLAGCWPSRESEPLADFSSHTCPQTGEIRRIAVLPLTLGDGVGRSAGAIDAAITASLRELDCYEVIAVDDARRDALLAHDAVLANGISSGDLLRLRDALHVDGVLIGRVDQFHGYDPLAIGLTMHLVSCIDGTVLWSATGHFDGARGDIQRDIKRWHKGAMGEGQRSISGWRATLSSPSLFCRYVGDRLAASVPYKAN